MREKTLYALTIHSSPILTQQMSLEPQLIKVVSGPDPYTVPDWTAYQWQVKMSLSLVCC